MSVWSLLVDEAAADRDDRNIRTGAGRGGCVYVCTCVFGGVSADREIPGCEIEREICYRAERSVRYAAAAVVPVCLGDDADRLHGRHRAHGALGLCRLADAVGALETEEVVAAGHERPGDLLVAAHDALALARA